MAKSCKYNGCEGCIATPTCRPSQCKAYRKANGKVNYEANKEERSQKYKAYYQVHKESVKANVKQYRLDNHEMMLARDKQYYEAHKEAKNARSKADAEARPEEVKAYKHQYYIATREETLARVKQYSIDNAEYIRAYRLANRVLTGDVKALMHEDGSITRMRSMSEVYFFSMLEEEGMDYIYEVPLETPMGVYIADGYLPELNIYVEVKADYYVRDDQMAKINYLREQGYSIIMIDSNLIDGEFGF